MLSTSAEAELYDPFDEQQATWWRSVVFIVVVALVIGV